jgi:tripartite-type tricarboxylate transporter receptor subunit TctC
MKGVTPFISGIRILAKVLGLHVRINVIGLSELSKNWIKTSQRRL